MVKSLFLIGLLCATNVSGAVVNEVVNGSVSTRVNDNIHVLDLVNGSDSSYLVNDNLIYRGFTFNTGTINSSYGGVVNSSVVKYFNTDINYALPGFAICNYPFQYKYVSIDGNLVPAFNSDYIYAAIINHNEYYFSNIGFYSDYKPTNDFDGFTNSNVGYSRGLKYINFETNMLGYYSVSLNLFNDYTNELLSFNGVVSTANVTTDTNWVQMGGYYSRSYDLNTLFNNYVYEYFNDYYDSLYYSINIVFTPFKSNSTTDINVLLNDAYQNGYDTGYRIGLHDGRSESNTFTFSNLFGSIANTPILYLKALFNFEFFGIKIYTVVLGLITTLLVIWVVKRFI